MTQPCLDLAREYAMTIRPSAPQVMMHRGARRPVESTPELPYPEPDGERTAGHSGTDTSRERAVSQARSGTAQKRMDQVLAYTAAVGRWGITVADLRDVTGWHHGSASSALSGLHKAGRIARLTEVRDRCKVYVYPDYVGDRATEPYRRNKATAQYGAWTMWQQKLMDAAETDMERAVIQRVIERVVASGR